MSPFYDELMRYLDKLGVHAKEIKLDKNGGDAACYFLYDPCIPDDWVDMPFPCLIVFKHKPGDSFYASNLNRYSQAASQETAAQFGSPFSASEILNLAISENARKNAYNSGRSQEEIMEDVIFYKGDSLAWFDLQSDRSVGGWRGFIEGEARIPTRSTQPFRFVHQFFVYPRGPVGSHLNVVPKVEFKRAEPPDSFARQYMLGDQRRYGIC